MTSPTIEERERRAYADGDAKTAELLGMILDAEHAEYQASWHEGYDAGYEEGYLDGCAETKEYQSS